MSEGEYGRVILREAGQVDQPLLRQVLLDAYAQYEQKMDSQAWASYKESITAAIAADNTLVKLLAEVEGQAVGAVLLYGSSDAAYGKEEIGIHDPVIRLLGVRRSARGTGVATALLRSSLVHARVHATWAQYLYLHTSDLMPEAVALYEKLGFERVPEKEFDNEATHVKCYRIALNDVHQAVISAEVG